MAYAPAFGLVSDNTAARCGVVFRRPFERGAHERAWAVYSQGKGAQARSVCVCECMCLWMCACVYAWVRGVCLFHKRHNIHVFSFFSCAPSLMFSNYDYIPFQHLLTWCDAGLAVRACTNSCSAIHAHWYSLRTWGKNKNKQKNQDKKQTKSEFFILSVNVS